MATRRGARRHSRVAAFLAVLGVVASPTLAVPLAAQDTTRAAASNEELAKQLANPVSSLVSVPFQFNWEQRVGPTDDGMRMVLNIQPVVPFALSPKWTLITRWVMPYIAQPEALGSASGFGDVVFSTFLSPAKGAGVTWGAGPAFVIPLTTNPALGAGKWSAGATGVVLAAHGPWTYGVLANQLWSVANASSAERAAVSQALVQPFLTYVTKGGVTFSLTSEAIANWEADDDRWTVPIVFAVSKLTHFGPFPFNVQGGAGVYVAGPDDAPDWKLRTAFILLLPGRG